MSLSILIAIYVIYALAQSILVVRFWDYDKEVAIVIVLLIFAPAVTLFLGVSFMHYLISLAIGKEK